MNNTNVMTMTIFLLRDASSRYCIYDDDFRQNIEDETKYLIWNVLYKKNPRRLSIVVISVG